MKNHSALLIVDVQLALFYREKYDGKKLFKSEVLLKNISHLIDKANKCDVPTIYIQHTMENSPILSKGKPGWDIHPSIKPSENATIIQKSHLDAFLNTPLNVILKEKGVEKLIICGLQTEFCVDTTCRRAFSLGYQNILVSDGHSTFDSDILNAEQIINHHNLIWGGVAPMKEMRFGTVCKTEDIDL